MVQKVKDCLELLRKERKYQVLILIIGFSLCFLYLSQDASRSTHRSARRAPKPPAINPLASSEAYADLMVNFGGKLASMEEKLVQVSVALDDQSKRQSNFERTAIQLFRTFGEKIQEQQSNVRAPAPWEAEIDPDSAADSSSTLEPEHALAPPTAREPLTMEIFSVASEVAAMNRPRGNSNRKAVVGAGDYARVRLVTGVAASTDGTPYPVMFKLASDIFGPDGSLLSLGEAHIVAAAQGSLSDQRVLFRLSTLNVRLPDGRRKVLEIDGWVVGEDGVRGMSGILKDPFDKVIAAAALAGSISGFGEAISTKNITRNQDIYGGNSIEVSGSESEYATATGLTKAADTYAKLIQDRTKELVPLVEVYSGREVTALFAKSFTIDSAPEAFDTDFAAGTALD